MTTQPDPLSVTASIAADAADHFDPPAIPVKPGYRTTEFWLSLAALLLSSLFASGVLTNSTALAIAGMAATVLTAAGYKVSRTLVKNASMLGLIAMIGVGLTSSGCATARQEAPAIAHAVLDCTKIAAPQLASQAVQLALDLSDGHVEWDAWIASAILDASNIKACVLAEYEATKLQERAGVAVSALMSEPDELAAGLARLRAARGVTSIMTAAGQI